MLTVTPDLILVIVLELDLERVFLTLSLIAGGSVGSVELDSKERQYKFD